MIQTAAEFRIKNVILLSLFLTTLVITPWINLDPINLPKFAILLTSGFFLLALLLSLGREIRVASDRNLGLALISFLLVATLSFTLNGLEVDQLFGVFGRNTGLLSYVALSIFLWSSSVVSQHDFGIKVLFLLLFIGLVNAVYGLIQLGGFDPIDWANPYNPVVGTLGNPNFISALLGLSSLSVLAFGSARRDAKSRIFLSVVLIFMLYIVYQSDSIQGLAIFGFGAPVFLFARYFLYARKELQVTFLILFISTSVTAFFGLINRGPLKDLLYQESVLYRLDYWQAGWQITSYSPILGIGFDRYGDFYRSFRSEEAALRRGPDVVSDSSHNVFLDLSSNGGFLLLISYLFIIGIVMRSCFYIIKRTKGKDSIGVGLIVVWLSYLFQSVFSINQLGLAIWGWVIAGAIVGYEKLSEKRFERPRTQQLITPKSVVFGAIGILVGGLTASFPLVQDYKFRSALEKADAVLIEDAALIWPRNSYYINYASEIFLENELYEKALFLAKKSSKNNPRDFIAFSLIYQNPNSREEEKKQALSRMKALDPWNTELP